jgi:uncharacterized membrane-anchored protein YjiN (DUF445 family)
MAYGGEYDTAEGSLMKTEERLRASANPADAERLVALRRMKRFATALLLLAAVVFAVAFSLQDAYPWLAYVRAAAEGAMVGAIADWFAVTALFRYPLGLRIPHTAIIPNRKDEIGASLGDFIEENFLSEEVIRSRLATFSAASHLGAWIAEPANAERVSSEVATAASGLLRFLSDDDVKDAIEKIARRHLFEPEWGPSMGRLGMQLVAAGRQSPVIDAAIDGIEAWLFAHPDALGDVVSKRLPSWVPVIVGSIVDDRAHREVLKLLSEVRADPDHPLRVAIDDYLVDLTEQLQYDPAMIDRVEAMKAEFLASPRLRDYAGDIWESVKLSASSALADPNSELRRGAASAFADIGARLAADPVLSAKVDAWMADAASYLVTTYRHDLASVITDTIKRWDPHETTEKIETQVGRDLQFIRINGTVVGAIAGLALFAIATGIHALF